MAAKKPAAKKTAKSVKSSKTTQAKVKTRKKAIYTAAQRKAYQAASRAAIRRVQVLHNTTVYRARRRVALQSLLGKLRAKGGQYFANRAKAYAARQAYLQAKSYNPANKTLSVQQAHRLFKAQSVATQRHFAFKGQGIHVQAYRTARVKKKATAAPRKRRARTGRTANPYKAFGAEFGRAAALRLPGPKPRVKKPSPKQKPKGTVATPKKRKAAGNTPVLVSEWITAGNDDGADNCVAVAIANHLLYHTGHRMTDIQVNYLRWEKYVAKALERIDYGDYWKPVSMDEYGMVYLEEAAPGMVIGYESENGSHCGLLLPDNKVVSWGEIVTLESPIEEAWTISWTTRTS